MPVKLVEPKLDHFKVYKQYRYQDQPRTRLQLKGQFDRAAVRDTIGHMPYFANPVGKDRGRILDKNAHLAFYELHPRKEPRRTVVLRNQFGVQKLLIGRAAYLLAPSRKIERGSRSPRRLSHFKAYEVLDGGLVDRSVVLTDQIDRRQKVEVTRPVFFCVPVAKAHGRRKARIVDPKAHLTFYAITPKVYKVPKQSLDQFGKHDLLIATSVFLGVPTLKLDWDTVG